MNNPRTEIVTRLCDTITMIDSKRDTDVINGSSKTMHFTLTAVVQWAEHCPGKAKGHRFNAQSEHMPGLWVQSPVRACARTMD